jgi:hypothetical protein
MQIQLHEELPGDSVEPSPPPPPIPPIPPLTPPIPPNTPYPPYHPPFYTIIKGRVFLFVFWQKQQQKKNPPFPKLAYLHMH